MHIYAGIGSAVVIIAIVIGVNTFIKDLTRPDPVIQAISSFILRLIK